MLKHCLMLAAATTLLAACGAENPTAPAAARLSPSSARAAVVAHPEPGTPGTAGCRGQTIAYIAQLCQGRWSTQAPTDWVELPVRRDECEEIQAIADSYCASSARRPPRTGRGRTEAPPPAAGSLGPCARRAHPAGSDRLSSTRAVVGDDDVVAQSRPNRARARPTCPPPKTSSEGCAFKSSTKTRAEPPQIMLVGSRGASDSISRSKKSYHLSRRAGPPSRKRTAESAITSASNGPPPIEPSNFPSSKIRNRLPTFDGPEPFVSTTVASATLPFSCEMPRQAREEHVVAVHRRAIVTAAPLSRPDGSCHRPPRRCSSAGVALFANINNLRRPAAQRQGPRTASPVGPLVLASVQSP